MKRFIRKNGFLGGVCGGLGDYFDIDPVFFRMAAMLFCMFTPVTIIFYLLICLISDCNE
jgi:phage shock protein PspC (stress-responsive transcriptional regulator)